MPIATLPAIDLKLVVPFVKAVRELFGSMVKTDVSIGQSYVKADTGLTHEVTGIIGFTGELVGSIAASFSADAAVKLVESFCGMKLATDSPDFLDAIGELANMIAGTAKREMRVKANITVPTVILGPGVRSVAVGAGPCLVIPCTTPLGDFAVEVSLARAA